MFQIFPKSQKDEDLPTREFMMVGSLRPGHRVWAVFGHITLFATVGTSALWGMLAETSQTSNFQTSSSRQTQELLVNSLQWEF